MEKQIFRRKQNIAMQYYRFRFFAIVSANIDYNPGQSIQNKIEKSGKIGQDKKSLTPIFACFLTVIAKAQFLEETLDTTLISPL